jgi:hypothetical protein
MSAYRSEESESNIEASGSGLAKCSHKSRTVAS